MVYKKKKKLLNYKKMRRWSIASIWRRKIVRSEITFGAFANNIFICCQQSLTCYIILDFKHLQSQISGDKICILPEFEWFFVFWQFY